MKFIINETIIYDENDGTLERVDDDNSKTLLQNPTRRMLSIFVRKNDVVVHRETLLNDVWEEHGLKASNNNLNTYASSLRRSFARLGEEDILVTLPRQGFKFSADSIREEKITNTISTHEVQQAGQASRSWRHSTRKRKFIMLSSLLLMGVIFMVCVIGWKFFFQSPPAGINIASKGAYKSCNIYIVKNESADLAEIKKAISQAGFDCSVNANVYYYGRQEKQKMMLAYCPVDILSPCRNTG